MCHVLSYVHARNLAHAGKRACCSAVLLSVARGSIFSSSLFDAMSVAFMLQHMHQLKQSGARISKRAVASVFAPDCVIRMLVMAKCCQSTPKITQRAQAVAQHMIGMKLLGPSGY
jgi:hypothetical protein